jgi:hypothetical protein
MAGVHDYVADVIGQVSLLLLWTAMWFDVLRALVEMDFGA